MAFKAGDRVKISYDACIDIDIDPDEVGEVLGTVTGDYMGTILVKVDGVSDDEFIFEKCELDLV
jgi:hypothetical protein